LFTSNKKVDKVAKVDKVEKVEKVERVEKVEKVEKVPVKTKQYSKVQIAKIFAGGYINLNRRLSESEEKEFRDIIASLNDAKIIVSMGDDEFYSQIILVIFEKHDKLYIVEGSHCSCGDFKGQWEPAEYSYTAMLMRSWGTWDKEKLYNIARRRLVFGIGNKVKSKSKNETNVFAGWLSTVEVGTKVWLVKEKRVVEITKKWASIRSTWRSFNEIGKIGISGDDNLWFVSMLGKGLDGKPLITLLEEAVIKVDKSVLSKYVLIKYDLSKSEQFKPKSETNIFAGWLGTVEVGTKVWLVKEKRIGEVTKKWSRAPSIKNMGQIGLNGDLWHMSINGKGFDGKPLICPRKF